MFFSFEIFVLYGAKAGAKWKVFFVDVSDNVVAHRLPAPQARDGIVIAAAVVFF